MTNAGEHLLVPSEMDPDFEQLIKGGPFELSLAADRLGNNLFGINSGAQVSVKSTCACCVVSLALSAGCLV